MSKVNAKKDSHPQDKLKGVFLPYVRLAEPLGAGHGRHGSRSDVVGEWNMQNNQGLRWC